MHISHDDIPETALNWHKSGQKVALATVIETWGSAPRPVGSQLVISEAGDMMGSVSGGCVEGATVIEAAEAIAEGFPRILEYGVTDEDAFSVGLACGGRIKILVEPIGTAFPVDLLEELVRKRDAHIPVAYIVNLDTWQRSLSEMTKALAHRFRADQSGVEGDQFVTIHNPPLRMAIIGGVHIAQCLIPMARAVGFAPVIIDPREAFASAARFPGETLIHDWPDEGLKQFRLDSRSAVVLLSHDPKLDDPALLEALKSECFYIGALGSKRTHAKRQDRLRGAGISDVGLQRIYGPIGLDIGSKTPAEIALSIMAEIILFTRKSSAT